MSLPPADLDAMPEALRLAWWGTAWLRGHIVADLLVDAVIGGDATHVVTADPGEPADALIAGLGRLRALGATGFGAAFPAEGDPVGLGGPAGFNTAALEAGQAVMALDAGLGLVPVRVGRAVTWEAHPAKRRQVPDVGDADRTLRTTLLEAAETLARLDVASWRPEAADLLLDLRHRPALVAPDGTPARCVDLASRGLQAAAIVDLALESDDGTLTAYDAEVRRQALLPLGRAARRALVAAGSPEAWPPD